MGFEPGDLEAKAYKKELKDLVWISSIQSFDSRLGFPLNLDDLSTSPQMYWMNRVMIVNSPKKIGFLIHVWNRFCLL